MSVDVAGHVIGPAMAASPAAAHAPAISTRAEGVPPKRFPPTKIKSLGDKPVEPRKHAPSRAWMAVAPLVIVAIAVVALRTRYAAAPTSAPIVGAKARLVVVATPADAHIFVDDVAIGDNPAQLTFPRNGVAHKIRVEAEGFITKDDTVVLDGASVNLELALDRASPPTASAGKAPDPPTPSERGTSHPHGPAKAPPSGPLRPVAGSKAPAAPNVTPSPSPSPAAASAIKPVDPTSGKKLLDTGDPWTR